MRSRCFAVLLAILGGCLSIQPADSHANPTVADTLSQRAYIFGQREIFFLDNGVLESDVVGVFEGDQRLNQYVHGATGQLTSVALLNNEILVSDYQFNRIVKLSTDGTSTGDFIAPSGPLFRGPVHIESDRSGSVYAANWLTGVTRYDSSGTLTGEFTHATLTRPWGVDADGSGNIYVSDQSINELFKFAPTGELLGTFRVAGFDVRDIAIDESGERLFMSTGALDISGPAGVRVFDISQQTPEPIDFVPGPGDTFGRGELFGIHFDDSTRHLYAVDGLGGYAYEFDENLQHVASFQTFGNGDFQGDIVTLPIPTPSSMTLMCLACPLFLWWRQTSPSR